MPPTKSNAEIVAAIEALGLKVDEASGKVDENTKAQRRLEKRVAVALAGDIEDPEGKPGVNGRLRTLEDGAESCQKDRGKLWSALKTVCGLVVTILLAIVGWVLAKL